MSVNGQVRKDLELPQSVSSPQAKLVYFYLDRLGPAPADEVAETLDLQKLAVYGVLRTLSRRELVEERENGYVTI